MNLNYIYAFSTEKWSKLQLSGKRSYNFTFNPVAAGPPRHPPAAGGGGQLNAAPFLLR